MAKRFFRRHQGRGSYDLFSSYRHYLPGWKGTFVLLGLFVAGALLGNLAVLALTKVFGNAFAADYGTVISYPIMFIPAMLYASVQSRLNEHRVKEVSLDAGSMGGIRHIFVAVTATIALAYIAEPVIELLPPMPEWLEKAMKGLIENTPVWIALISVSVFAPFFEEWLCRGIILRGLLANRMNPTSAIVVSSAFFALLHMNPWQAIPAFLLGSLFGYVYYRTGSLKLTMLMHCVNNTTAVALSKISAFKDAESFMDLLSPWAYWCIYAACIVIVVCTIAIFGSYSQPEKESQTYPRQ